MEDWEEKKHEVLQQLPLLDVNQLTTICGALSITVPPVKMGKRSAIFNLIMRHLNSETVEDSADQGLQLFEDIDGQLKGMLAGRVKVETKSSVDTSTTNSNITGPGTSDGGSKKGGAAETKGISSSVSGVDSTVRLHLNRLREFKIHGVFVATGENPITYSNLKF